MAPHMRIIGILYLLSVGTGPFTASFAAEPIKLGFEAALTGGSSSIGVPMRNSVELAIAEINSHGGINGRPLVLVQRDDEGKNELGVQIARELIEKEQVVAMLGYTNTGVALASQRFFQDASTPVLTIGPTGTIITQQFRPPGYSQNYIFRISVSDSIQSEMIAAEAIDRAKFTRVAIFADTTNYGQLGRADLEAALARRGVTAVAIEKFNIGDVDMTAQILRAKDANAQALLTYGIGPELAQIANGMAKLNWRVPMIGSWTLSYANFIDNAGANGDGARMPQSFVEDASTPKRKAYLEAYNKAYGRNTMPSAGAQAFDAVQLLAAALRQSDSIEGSKILDALENLKEPVEGVVTTYNQPFSASNHEAYSAEIAVMGEVRNGHLVLSNERAKSQ
jgi:branched-chain amino acid transport system substrate-binding protein